MPIRHCQKCGLKVLIDESQEDVNPFYCQRCTAALKSDGASGAAAPRAGRVTPVSTPQPAGMVTAAGTVKVHCPYCQASFNGRVPQKPARGQCPLCHKDLVLLPNGDIRPSAGFDLPEWQKAEASSGKSSEDAPAAEGTEETGTRVLVKKYAADVPTEDAAISNPDAPAALPDWMDNDPKPPPEPTPTVDVADAVRLDEIPPPEPPPIPPPPQVSPKRSGSTTVTRKVTTDRRTRPQPAGVGAPQGAGRFLLGLVLVALPLIACPILLNQRDALLTGTPIEKLGAIFSKGFLALDANLFPEELPEKPPPPKPQPPPPAPEAPAQPSAEDKVQWETDITKLIEQTRRRKRDLATSAVAATPEQKAALQEVQAEQDRQLKKLAELQGIYTKLYGKPYDPEKQ